MAGFGINSDDDIKKAYADVDNMAKSVGGIISNIAEAYRNVPENIGAALGELPSVTSTFQPAGIGPKEAAPTQKRYPITAQRPEETKTEYKKTLADLYSEWQKSNGSPDYSRMNEKEFKKAVDRAYNSMEPSAGGIGYIQNVDENGKPIKGGFHRVLSPRTEGYGIDLTGKSPEQVNAIANVINALRSSSDQRERIEATRANTEELNQIRRAGLADKESQNYYEAVRQAGDKNEELGVIEMYWTGRRPPEHNKNAINQYNTVVNRFKTMRAIKLAEYEKRYGPLTRPEHIAMFDKQFIDDYRTKLQRM